MDSSTSSKRYVLYACAAAGAAGYAWLKLSSKQNINAPTDFDAFLHTPVPAAPASSASETSFESFLKVQQPVHPCSTDFASFLKDGGNANTNNTSAGAQQQQPAAAAADQQVIPEDVVPVVVLYGTEYGFAREIAEKLSQQLQHSGKFWPLLMNAADHPQGVDFSQHQAALMVFSTQGDGVPPTEAREFCDWLTSGQAGGLAHINYSVCALGDTSYTHFCRCGKSLDAALSAAGAAPLLPRADIDKEDWPKVDAWIQGALEALTAALPCLDTFADRGGVEVFGLSSSGSNGSAAAAAAVQKGCSKSRPYYARVMSVGGLCVLRDAADKDTVRVVLQLEGEAVEAGGLSYSPGDALGIWPTNPPQAVDELLQQLGATGEEAVPRPSWHYQEQQQQQQQQDSSTITLRHALSVCYDIKTPKAKPLMQLLKDQLAAAAADKGPRVRPSIDLQVDATSSGAADAISSTAAAAAAADKGSKLQAAAAAVVDQLAAVEGVLQADAAAVESYLSARHVVDILQHFSGAHINHTQLLSVLRPLQPRLYSISSSPLETDPANSAVEATIAVVRYTSLDKERQGVASTQVAERLAPGSLLPIFISKNPDFRLPPSPSTPIIMVGPGTGLAPFRSFILQRLLEQQHQQQQGDGDAAVAAAVGPMHLFFGCRRRDQDFLYGDQLEAWHASGAITLHTAFSRESSSKVYVQQRLREAADEVWTLLEAGGHFYVCGDAGSMAGAVEKVLLDIIAQNLKQNKQGISAEGDEVVAAAAKAAEAYLEQLSSTGRYQRDVWFS